jgi:SHS2 domain-containing protein
MGTGMVETRKRWEPERRARAYSELEHPSDLFLEIHGRDLRELFENGLFAFYDQVAQIEGFGTRRELTLSVREPGLDEALRSLLSEALYCYDTEGFVAAGGEVNVERRPATEAAMTGEAGTGPAGPAAEEWSLQARLWGDNADRERHTLLREVKAVTYHLLTVIESGEGWKATVLLDI